MTGSAGLGRPQLEQAPLTLERGLQRHSLLLSLQSQSLAPEARPSGRSADSGPGLEAA